MARPRFCYRYSDVFNQSENNPQAHTRDNALASKPFLILGNISSIVLAIVALLQLLSWTLAGLLILATLTLTTLASIRPTTDLAVPKRPANQHPTTTETRPHRERPTEKQAAYAHQTSKSEQKPQPRQDHPRNALPSATPTKITAAKTSPVKPAPAGLEPNMAPTIAKGDYASYDIELEEGKEFVGEVSANGLVNVYLLNDENLTSLDLDQEFWYEAGAEGVQKATLHFTAPENGEWFFIVENADNKPVSAAVNIQKSSARTGPSLTPQAPSLLTDSQRLLHQQ